jgi:hypothetical protein
MAPSLRLLYFETFILILTSCKILAGKVQAATEINAFDDD